MERGRAGRERCDRGRRGEPLLSRRPTSATEFFEPSDTHTVCPWKGTASYRTVVVDGARNEDAAWYYPDPKDAAAEITDRVAFWKGVTVEEV